VTSPPYWGLRDYGHADQIGQETTPELFVQTMVEVFREVRRVLKADGTCWLNLGDSYFGSWGNYSGGNRGKEGGQREIGRGSQVPNPAYDGLEKMRPPTSLKHPSLKPKDIVGIPWRVAFALQADGWYLRQDIIWAKPNPMPESVTDRCTKSHEYIFLLSKSERYYYNHEAIKERQAESSVARLSQDVESQRGSDRVPGKTNGTMKAVGRGGKNAFRGQGHFREGAGAANRDGRDMKDVGAESNRNKRSVWTVTTQPYKEAHFATYPPDLIKPCIMAGTKPGDVVLDPFGGSGTTGQVALELGRKATLIELNPDYAKIIDQRTAITPGLALD
jgi:DNA modification methylase